MTKWISEYRINKKGAECFRTMDADKAYSRLTELQAKRPGVYTMQRRIAELDRHGVTIRDWRGETLWTTWRNC